ncbi:MAG: hypothetical protein ACJATI_005235 [Halioglobus sp.]|jgi:hypothetical protein
MGAESYERNAIIMEDRVFNKIFERIVYFYDIHKNSHHAKIANLSYEEYIGLLLEIINDGGWKLLKKEIEGLSDRKFQQRLITLLTPIDFDCCKSLYKRYLDKNVPEYMESEPYGWKNFTDEEYILGARELLQKVAKKRKISFTILNLS